jgi:class 3 adenylate cyclase
MSRRSRAGGKPVKARRRKTTTLKHRNAAKTTRQRGVSIAGQETVVARLTRERDEALEQLSATSEVLKVISSTPGELKPVFQEVLESAVRICEAKFAHLQLYEDGAFRIGAMYNTPAAFAEARERQPVIRPSAVSPLGRVVATKLLLHIIDYAEEPTYKQRAPNAVRLVELAGARTLLIVPMLIENSLIGTISIYRQEVRPFTDKQIALVQNFAAQAAIAIENTRLLNELRQRTGDLTEALEQQTATSEVLKVISSSPGELEPVFNTMLANATRLCDAKFGILYFSEGDGYRAVAMYNVPLALVEARQNKLLQFPADAAVTMAATSKQPCHHIDARAQRSYIAGDPEFAASVNLGGMRTVVSVPILKDGQLIGVISIYRQEVRPFTDKQIALVENFAAQAVIAIENARLLDDLNKLNQQLEQRVADQVGEIERMSRLRRFLPPQVADLIVASGTEKQLESHRREITALFCDLRGFTGFSESSDPEDVMALLRDYHAAIGQIIIKYSGTLERFAGDGVMVIFNDPVPVENPALQAVLMALDMRTAIGGMIEKWRDLGHDLGFGIGIAHGFATLGTIGFEGRFDYAAIGTVSNVASRLCDEAKPGQILISPRVRQAVDEAVTVEPVGEFTLKGIRRPMMTYNVLESSPSKLN